MGGIKRALKRWIPRGLLGRPLAYVAVSLARWSGKRAGVAIAYHRVGDPQGDPARELVPALGTALFEAQLRHMKALYRVVPAAELFDAAMSRKRGQRFPVAITFDDDLPSHRAESGAILTRVRVPATFFACGASLERPFAFWWEQLQAAVDAGIEPLEPSQTIHDAGRRIQAMSPEGRDAEGARLEALVGGAPADAGMRREDVRALAEGGFEIGFHTLRHYWLPGLTDDQLERAMRDGRQELEAAAGSPLTTIAYPHGGGDDRVAAAARAAGYVRGFTTGDGAVTPDTNPLLIERLEPSFRSRGHFAFELAFTLIRGRWLPA